VATWTDSIEQVGFASASDVFSSVQMDDVLRNLARIPLPRSRAGIRHAMRNPSVAAIARGYLLEIAKTVLGYEALPYRATLFDKSPGSNWLVVWHQDTALPLVQKNDVKGWGPWSTKDGVLYAHAPTQALAQVLALRIHLDDSTTRNGPLRVLPGTHDRGVLTNDEIHRVAQRIDPVECTVPRGGVLAMRPLLIHSSSKSVAEIPRRVLHIEYAATPVLEGLRLAVA
jgi:ectoine hydroxylase-related dioxygenase (phytanoyl-CoA dioxygenase family)